MGGSADELILHEDGTREEIRYRRRQGSAISRVRRIIGPDGVTREIWHEVMDATGNMLHQHRIEKRDRS